VALVAGEKTEPPAPVTPEGHLGIGDLRQANSSGANSNRPAATHGRRAANER
jgi:hypothetical protein